MYVVGTGDRHKVEARILVERLIVAGEKLVTDAEVLQEILHRYTTINRREAINEAFSFIAGVVDEIFPMEKKDLLRASEIVRAPAQWSARDAVHIAVMERRGVKTILSFDADFDKWPGLRRIHYI